VNLSEGEGSFVPIDQQSLRRFLGGSGLGVYLLLQSQSPEADPLSAESSLVFTFSPLVGSPLTTSAKFAVVSKSPLTNRINDSLASSGFAIAGKKCGCDAIVITGRASRPSILVIDNGNVRLESADELWGLTIDEAEIRLAERLGIGFHSAVIGPAGERQVLFATISHDGRHAGRGGSGAVLGAKNIKAVAVRGTHRCEWAHPVELAEYAKRLSKRSFGPATAKYRELGTASNLLLFNRLNTLPTRNFQQGHFAAAAELSPERLSTVREKTQASCVACTIGCEHIYSLGTKGDPNSKDGHVRLEYENLFALGPLCDVAEPDKVLRASRRCDELGLDTISTGGTIAFAMECVERGLLNEPWLRFGDGDALLRAIDLIGHREGFGNSMAEGSRRLAEQIGGDSISFAPQVKGLEIPGYEPREMQTMALGFAVGARGADHNRSGAYEADFSEKVDRRNLTGKSVAYAIETEDNATLLDSLILCKFLRGVFDDLTVEVSEMLNLVTGWDTTAAELRQTARRIVTAKKLFNIRAGWTPGEDVLPARFITETCAEDNATKLHEKSLHNAISRYNESRGWTTDGWPAKQCLDDLGLSQH
jgi:aldehyde:ferredoxin oxidoreductase